MCWLPVNDLVWRMRYRLSCLFRGSNVGARKRSAPSRLPTMQKSLLSEAFIHQMLEILTR
jgi:hypothetical protein